MLQLVSSVIPCPLCTVSQYGNYMVRRRNYGVWGEDPGSWSLDMI